MQVTHALGSFCLAGMWYQQPAPLTQWEGVTTVQAIIGKVCCVGAVLCPVWALGPARLALLQRACRMHARRHGCDRPQRCIIQYAAYCHMAVA